MHVFFRVLALAACLAVAGPVLAQSAGLVPMSEFYFDADASTTRPIEAARGQGEALVERLAKAVARNPRDAAAAAHLAHVAMEGGRPQLGHELYGRALGLVDSSNRLYRPLRWNYGWDLYRTGDAQGALDQWKAVLDSRSVSASWMPPTFALVLWTLGRREEAVQWYAAAVRSEPSQWTTAERHAELLPDWRPAELETLAQVQQAWQEAPPAWP